MKCPVLLLSLAALLALSSLHGCATGTSRSNRPAAAARVEQESAAEERMIRVAAPLPGAVIRSPLTVRGEARGPWYFEGDFPLLLRDPEGNILARGFASARGEWMTTDFVPFTGRLTFVVPQGRAGELVLQKDNPSGRRELDDSLVIPVRFR